MDSKTIHPTHVLSPHECLSFFYRANFPFSQILNSILQCWLLVRGPGENLDERKIPFICRQLVKTFTRIQKGILSITTRPPAVPDVFESGHNVGALRKALRVSFR